jgi:hypothetical protein
MTPLKMKRKAQFLYGPLKMKLKETCLYGPHLYLNETELLNIHNTYQKQYHTLVHLVLILIFNNTTDTLNKG